MYKNHNSLLHNIGVIALCYTSFLCPEHNMNIIRVTRDRGPGVQASPASLRCVLEQDTLILA